MNKDETETGYRTDNLAVCQVKGFSLYPVENMDFYCSMLYS